MRIIFENTQNTRPILENSLKYIRSDVHAVSQQAQQYRAQCGISPHSVVSLVLIRKF